MPNMRNDQEINERLKCDQEIVGRILILSLGKRRLKAIYTRNDWAHDNNNNARTKLILLQSNGVVVVLTLFVMIVCVETKNTCIVMMERNSLTTHYLIQLFVCVCVCVCAGYMCACVCM